MTIQPSIGIALANVDRPGMRDDLVRRADAAMYAAKRQGGARWHLDDRVTVIGGPDDQPTLATDLPSAVAAGELHLVFQPITDLASGDLVAAEALVDWWHPTCGQLTYPALLSLAEQTGTTHDLGRWVLHHACQQARAWNDRLAAGLAPKLSVRLAAAELDRDSLVADVTTILDVTGFDPRRLVLDVHETALMNRVPVAARLAALRDLGIQIAVDGFDAGIAGPRDVTGLPVDILTFGRWYVTDITDHSQEPVVQAALRVAQLSNNGVTQSSHATGRGAVDGHVGEAHGSGSPMSADELERLVVTASVVAPFRPDSGSGCPRPSPESDPRTLVVP